MGADPQRSGGNGHTERSGGGTATATDFRQMPVDELLKIKKTDLPSWLSQTDMPSYVRDNIVGYIDALTERIGVLQSGRSGS